MLKIRTRLTVVTAALVILVLVGAGLFVVLRLRADLLATTDRGLQARADLLVQSVGPPGTLAPQSGLAEPEEAFAQLLDPAGRVLDSSPGFGGPALLTPAELASVDAAGLRKTVEVRIEEWLPARLLAVPVGDGRVLVVGGSIEDQQEAVARLVTLLAVSGPFVLALAAGVGWWVTGAALRPIEAMREQAAAISASDPDRRLPVPDTGDEVARLATTLNDMLDRLQSALERERRFVGDAGHELRTPLANLTAELDLALRRDRTAAELTQAVRSAAEETQRLSALAADLLVLARADGGRLPVSPEPVDVAALVRESVHGCAARAADQEIGVDVAVPDGLIADVDSRRLRQALGNLLDNALRHTPPGGRVIVAADRSNGTLTIEVSDTGAGFPEPFLPHAFEPFTRADAARSREAGGTGLGLAIARAIAQAHGGDASARNRPGGGAVVALRIPA